MVNVADVFCFLSQFDMSGIWLSSHHHTFPVAEPNMILQSLLFDVISREVAIGNQAPHCLHSKGNELTIPHNMQVGHILCVSGLEIGGQIDAGLRTCGAEQCQ